MKSNYSITFCTVVKNRLHHLQETLPSNIENNRDYPQLQFLVLDYNSTDNLEGWMRQTMLPLIMEGRVVYYKTPHPEYFHRAHSRNMAMRLASGDIICNVDADNFTGARFAAFVDRAFQKSPECFLTTYGSKKHVLADVLGRVCIRKADFFQVGGYDEAMEVYGFEDGDLVNRLMRLGRTRQLIYNKEFLKAIPHSDAERVGEEKLMKLCYKLYVHYVSPAKSDVLLLFSDNSYIRGVLVDEKSLFASHPKDAFKKRKLDYEYTTTNCSNRYGLKLRTS